MAAVMESRLEDRLQTDRICGPRVARRFFLKTSVSFCRWRGSEPKGQELIYAARVSLDRTHMQVDKVMQIENDYDKERLRSSYAGSSAIRVVVRQS
jgi:hypothetical protein